jgi:hypothetical protein
VKVNGIEMPALLDTGSPVTVLNVQAAKAAGVVAVDVPSLEKLQNPFTKLVSSFKVSQASSRGEILQLVNSNGQIVNLAKSVEQHIVGVVDDENNEIDFGTSHVYVGDLPGLAALNGIGVDSPLPLSWEWTCFENVPECCCVLSRMRCISKQSISHE